MTAKWKVNYKFLAGLEVENKVESYSQIGVSIAYAGNKLVEINHELKVDDGLEAGQVIALSTKELEFFWQTLQYRYGLPLPQNSMSAQKIAPEMPANVVHSGIVSISARASICLRIKMPNPAIFPGANSRLPILVRLANDSLTAVNPADAIRNSYMILEDLYPDCRTLSPSPVVTELIYVRDFVSHAKIKNPLILQFLKTKFGRPVDRYDPTDVEHQALVRQYRQSGRQLVDLEITKLL